MQEQEREHEPTRPIPHIVRVWRIVGPVLEMVALVAAHQQREGLALAAKALAVLGQSTTVWLVGRERR
ncbi:hypothetical protein [Micromonospora rosaria]|uniref:hypothetical protein n=1 Tax=Micromonospora rosaria TaxID=47874 RepID=UPI000AD660DF|nr:hypothetical protein [Micromonospora rosaria]